MATPASTATALKQLAEREERVFPSFPQVARYFPGASIEEARQRLSRTIERGDGPCVVVGGPGTGKSLLLQVLASQFHDRFDVVLPACARLCTRRALLQAILFELGLPYRVRDEGDLRLSLLDHLLSREACPSGLLLLVDEAQTLSPGLLDELRVLTNLVRNGSPRVRLILAGSSALEESFAHPELESFSQRLSLRSYLSPFNREETSQFVRAQVALCGASPEAAFNADAWEAIFEATDGVPRLVNQLCDRALLQAVGNGRTKIDRSVIQSAWADIQQLPAPWETPAPTTAPPAPLQVVEFGRLDDDVAELHSAKGNRMVVDRFDDETIDADLTEIDCEEDVVESPSVVQADVASAAVVYDAADPFAEKFDEEEVVLDNFAGWDDMFRREAPRVQNRRDPSFAALVEAAIPAGKTSHSVVSAADASAKSVIAVEPDAAPRVADEGDWPPLRLAFGSDSLSTSALGGDIPPTACPTAGRSEYDSHQAAITAWSRALLSQENSSDSIEVEDDPILIVEEDQPTAISPVRREEYRNLFSRLRGN
jgi:type II secretory pathway predicted ATPase ExeA